MDVSGHRGMCADAEHVAASKQRYLCALPVDRQQPIVRNIHPPMPAISTTLLSPGFTEHLHGRVNSCALNDAGVVLPAILYFWKRLAQLS